MSPGKRPRRNGNFPPKKMQAPISAIATPRIMSMRPRSLKESMAAKGTRGVCGRELSDTTKDLDRSSGGQGDAVHQVFLLVDGFRPNGERIEQPHSEGVANRFVLAIAQCALPEDFHSDDGFSRSTHFAQHARHRFWIGVHDRALPAH